MHRLFYSKMFFTLYGRMKQNEDTFLLKNAITCHDMLKH